jgi:hypothetical protein
MPKPVPILAILGRRPATAVNAGQSGGAHQRGFVIAAWHGREHAFSA